MKNIIIIAGLTGVGKSEIASYLQREYNAHFVVSISTRPMREGESEGNPYYFTDKDTFLSMVDSGEIFEHRSYDTLLGGNPDTWYYGCTLSEIKDNQLNVAVLDTVGAKEFYDKFGDRCTTIFVTAFKRIMEELIKQR
jgi:guanylate kinase